MIRPDQIKAYEISPQEKTCFAAAMDIGTA